MCSRIVISSVICVFLLVICVCPASGRARRLKRDHTESHTGVSKTVGDLVNDFLAELYGPNTSLSDVAGMPMNKSSKEALQSFLNNISQSTNANDTETDLQAQLQEVTSQETNQFTTTRKASSGVSSTSSPFSSSYFSSSSTWMYSGTDYPLEDDRCYTDAILQVKIYRNYDVTFLLMCG